MSEIKGQENWTISFLSYRIEMKFHCVKNNKTKQGKTILPMEEHTNPVHTTLLNIEQVLTYIISVSNVS